MSWAYGVDKNGREVGYGVEATCDHPDCKEEIDRGLSYRCGGVENLHDDYGCANFFCDAHMRFGNKDQLCFACYKEEPDDES